MNNKNLTTAGEFAKLVRTTKRTILWYDLEGILKPAEINDEGYRFYKSEQIIDFQVISMLRHLNFSINEIRSYLEKDNKLKNLFKLKEKTVKDEIKRLQKSLSDINSYYQNLETSGTLVNPTIKQVLSFEIYYLQFNDPYVKIYQHELELKSYFSKIPNDATFLVVFEDGSFKPKKAEYKVAVIIKPGLKLKKNAEKIVKKTTIPSFKALSYRHVGSPTLNSMIWSQMREWRNKRGLEFDRQANLDGIEFYPKTAINGYFDENYMVTEINLPVK